MIGLKEAAASVGAMGVIGGGALTLDHMHVPAGWAKSHEADHRVRTIFELADRSKASGSPDWLCDAIEQEFIALCSDTPEHYLCKDPKAKADIKRGAGCE